MDVTFGPTVIDGSLRAVHAPAGLYAAVFSMTLTNSGDRTTNLDGVELRFYYGTYSEGEIVAADEAGTRLEQDTGQIDLGRDGSCGSPSVHAIGVPVNQSVTFEGVDHHCRRGKLP